MLPGVGSALGNSGICSVVTLWPPPQLLTTCHRLSRIIVFTTCVLACVRLAAAATLITPGAIVDLSPEGEVPSASLGSAVALENGTAVIAGLKSGGSGRAIVYASSGAQWNRVTHLELLDGVNDDTNFGAAVALSGDTIAVLARPAAGPTTAIYLFTRVAGTWSLQHTLTQNDWPVANVTTIALSGDTLLLGNPSDVPAQSTVASGRVDVFGRVGAAWVFQKTLRPSVPIAAEKFGASIAIDGDRLAVGAPRATVNKHAGQGACYVFTRGHNVWTQSAELTDSAGAAAYLFGTTLALSGGELLVGSPGRIFSTAKGSVLAFHLNSRGVWQEEGALPAPVPDPDGLVLAAPLAFGSRIALSGSLAVVGNATTLATTDRSYIYQHRGNHWVQLTPLGNNPVAYTGPDPGNPATYYLLSSPGGIAAVSGGVIVVGAPNENTLAGVHSGVARFYNYASNLAAFDGATLDAPELVPDTVGAAITMDLGDLVLGRTIKRSVTLQNLGIVPLASLSFTSDNQDVAGLPTPVATLATETGTTLNLTITPSSDGDWESHIVVKGTGVNALLTLDLIAQVVDDPTPPIIMTEPVSAIVGYQGPCQLSVQASGTAPLKYQWFHNGKPMAGAISNTLSLPAVVNTDAGTYTVTVTNDTGSDFSSAATISVYQVQATITLRLNEGSPEVLSAPVAGPGITVGWLLNGLPLNDDAVYSGTGTSTLVIKQGSAATAGKFSVVVNPGDLDITAKTWNISVLARPVIQSDVTPLASISIITGVTFHFVTSPAASSFVFTGVPPGLVTDAKTGTLTGRPLRPGLYSLHAAGINAAGTGPERVISVKILPIAAGAVGTFQGIIGRDAGNHNLGGIAVLTTTATGMCTGYTTAGADLVRFTTPVQLQSDGKTYQIMVQATVSGQVQIYTLNLDSSSGRLSGQFVSSLSPGAGSAITGWRNSWSTPANPATAWSDYLTCSLTTSPSITRPLIVPEGISYGTVAVSPAGIATWAGRMADGSVTTQSSVISPRQTASGGADHVEIPLHFLLTAGTGSAQGLLLISQSSPASPSFHGVGGGVDWLKLPGAGRSYAAGIDLHALAAAGGPYAPPAMGAIVLGLPVAGSNAQLSLAGAGIESVDQLALLGAAFTITTKSLAFFDASDVLGNTLAVNASTGTFSGSLTLTDTYPANSAASVNRIANSFGVLLPGQHQGFGFFLLPALPNPNATPPTTLITSPIRSGSVRLHAASGG